MNNFRAYLQAKNLSSSTIKAYLRKVNLFLDWFNSEPLNCEKKDVLKYLSYLKTKKGQSAITRSNNLIAISHYFDFLLQNGSVTSNPTAFIKIRGTKKKQLYDIYTLAELQEICDNYYHTYLRNFDDLCTTPTLGGIPANRRKETLLSRQRNYAILGFLIYQGLKTSEVENICLSDVDLNKAMLKVRGGRKSNPRNIPLEASQIGFLINYIQNIRPRFLACHLKESSCLFLPLPEVGEEKAEKESIKNAIKPLTKQVKEVKADFLNFKQVRASVITYWIKTVGLRKAQYFAGHRYISSTENYLPNDLESLTEDIEKYNPF